MNTRALDRTQYLKEQLAANRLAVPYQHLSEPVRKLLATPLSEVSRLEIDPTAQAITHTALVLDESGSMRPHAQAAIEGFNSQVEVIRDGAEQAGTTYVTLTQFAYQARPMLVARPVQELRPLTNETYNPNGGTALFDAIGLTIELLLEQPDIAGGNTAILVSAFTDGEENMSTRYDAQTLKHLIGRLEATGRWTFTLMGPAGSVELADVLSISRGNVATFDPASAASTRTAFATMSGAAQSYMSMRGMGIAASASLYAESAVPPESDLK